MSVRVTVSGLDELIRELTNAPEEIRAEAFEILKEETTGTAAEVTTVLSRHNFTGRLASSLRVTFPSSSILVGFIQIVAPHAHLQFGSKGGATGRGSNRRNWMKDVVAITQRRRDRMFERMRQMLVRRGFQVSE